MSLCALSRVVSVRHSSSDLGSSTVATNMERRPVTLQPADVAALFREQTPLAVGDALDVIDAAQRLMSDEPNMVAVAGATVYVFGDIHGQFFDLLQFVDSVGLDNLAERDIRLVFLGDYVDRGAFSCEVMLYLLLLKVRFPANIVLLRGNHECETISSFYGFRSECRVKYGLSVYCHFIACFQSMPIAALVKTPRGDIFCVHGGLSPDLMDLKEIEAIDRKREVPMEGPLCDLLWADPVADTQDNATTEAKWIKNTTRGCSFNFNAPALFAFLETNNLLSVFRAHEYEEAGYMYHFGSDNYDALDKRDDRSVPPLMTVFSAPNYCDTNGNKAGYVVVHSSPFRLEVRQIDTVGHPIPGLITVERSADIWRQFRQTLPFLPASKDFFEEVLRLASRARLRSSSGAASISPLEATTRGSRRASMSDPSEPHRRQRNEMHPQALGRALDEEAAKWMQSDDGDAEFAVFSEHYVPESTSLRRRGSWRNSRYRTKSLEPNEVEMMKLIFSLLDTDGSLSLSVPKVTQFVFNVLGEKISPQVAQLYLDALDFDRNGVVDFGDILSWAAVMKANYDRRNESIFSLSFIIRRMSRPLRQVDPYRGFLWLTVAYVIRDVVILKRTRLFKSKSLTSLVVLALVLYAMDVLRVCRSLRLNWYVELFPLWQLLAKFDNSNVRNIDDEAP